MPPWIDRGTKPTPEEWREWFLSCDEPEQLRISESVITAFDEAMVCRVGNHQERLSGLEESINNMLEAKNEGN